MERQIRRIVTTAFVLCTATATGLSAGEARLKNGVSIPGDPVPIMGLSAKLIRQSSAPTAVYPILLVFDGMRRYFVADRQTAEIDRAHDLSYFETFTLKQRKTGRKAGPSALGGLNNVEPFSPYGRRTVTVSTDRGTVAIVQGVTKITPRHLHVTGITHAWEHGLAVTSIPLSQLDAMLRKATKPSSPEDRMAIARFYMQAGYYRPASAELKSIMRDFPEMKSRVQEIDLELRQLQGKQIVLELKHRRQSGQHRLAHESTKIFPKERMSAQVLREVREITRDYETARANAEKAVLLLGELQAKLTDEKLIVATKPMRSEVVEKLSHESLPRLDAFLKLAADDTLKPAERLALAYSGWVLGAQHAKDDLELAVRLWHARFLVVEYLRSVNQLRRSDILRELKRLEGVGPEQIGWMIPHLPPILETPGIAAGKRTIVTAAGDAKQRVRYAVMLPPEYNPQHAYPMIVALRPAERTIEDEVVWWAGSDEKPGQAQRHGYIVIAPDYCPGKKGVYDYAVSGHAAVLQAIRDARKRFRVDSDRVFLAGHHSGADAVYDIGMSHPDLFAGLIAINGIMDKYCMWYWYNCKHLPIYAVNGELGRQAMERNARDVNRMLRKDYDIIYCEYLGRGYETYYDEIHRLFDWMNVPSRRRVKYPKDFDVRVLRSADDRWYWLKASGMPRNVLNETVLIDAGRRTPNRPMNLDARVTPGNTIRITGGASNYTLWLAPELIDFDKKATVSYRSRRLFHGFLKRDTETLLEDLRIRGDREKPYWMKLEL